MKYHAQEIPNVFLIEPTPFVDERGVFRRHFCARELDENGLVSRVQQANVSENVYAHTLRGFHYQVAPHGEDKTLSCFRGRIYDIVVDLRPDSPTFGKWQSFELNETNRLSLQVPAGCANAFLTLEDRCLIHYYCSAAYHPASERGIRFDDPFFKFVWPVVPQVISEKDRSHPDFVVPGV